jgi:hypothetical protein
MRAAIEDAISVSIREIQLIRPFRPKSGSGLQDSGFRSTLRASAFAT